MHHPIDFRKMAERAKAPASAPAEPMPRGNARISWRRR